MELQTLTLRQTPLTRFVAAVREARARWHLRMASRHLFAAAQDLEALGIGWSTHRDAAAECSDVALRVVGELEAAMHRDGVCVTCGGTRSHKLRCIDARRAEAAGPAAWPLEDG